MTEVRSVPGGVALPTGAWSSSSADTPGQIDAVHVGSASWADPLVVGAEPWHGGWANLLGGTQLRQVEVVGTFGLAVPPPVIVDAAVALAVWRLSSGSLVAASAAGPATPPTTDDEGNTVSITVDASARVVLSRTTGVPAVDAALAPFVPAPVRIG